MQSSLACFSSLQMQQGWFLVKGVGFGTGFGRRERDVPWVWLSGWRCWRREGWRKRVLGSTVNMAVGQGREEVV
jgi:hypothetical protein